MKYLKVHFLSQRFDWGTPQGVFDELDREFHFDLDACATKDNTKCARFYSPDDDALTHDWPGTVFMNPPYGREIGKWVDKARLEATKGSTIVCLLPARMDTQWLHRNCRDVDVEFRFIEGRLRFEGASGSAPFPSMILIFRPGGRNR